MTHDEASDLSALIDMIDGFIEGKSYFKTRPALGLIGDIACLLDHARDRVSEHNAEQVPYRPEVYGGEDLTR